MPEPASCGSAANCLASAQGVVIGRDASARLAASRELQSAAAHYSAWFQGKKAVPGLILLDAAAAGEASIVRGTLWTLSFYLAAKPGIEAEPALPPPRPLEASPRRALGDGTSLVVSQDGEFDVTRPGVLAHEICHRHASRAFEQAWGRTRALPDMLDEVAAVSCETRQLKKARLDLFVRLFDAGKLIPWDGFLVTRHPLKADPTMIRALRQFSQSGKGAVAFDIKPGSSHGSKVALFYSQAAAFGDFVSTRSCRGRQAIGGLLATYDPREGLDQWLRSNGARFCLPASISGFEESFSRFMQQRLAGRRTPS